MNTLLIIGIAIGFSIGIITALVAFVCLLEKLGDEIKHESKKKNDGEVFDYCQSCHEPIFITEQYIKDDDKNYCPECGRRQLRKGHQFIATKGDR